jgi:hypothetical protein
VQHVRPTSPYNIPAIFAFDPSIVVHEDFETRSKANLKKTGVRRYCQDPSTEVTILRYRFGEEGPVEEWRPGWAPPHRLLAHIAAGGRVCGHNIIFELYVTNIVLPRMMQNIWNHGNLIGPRLPFEWPKIKIEQCDCTMIRAFQLAFPGDLDTLGEVLRLDVKKDKEGAALMKKMCVPRKPRKGEDPSKTHWIEDDISLNRESAYCEVDVLTETGAGEKLHKMTPYNRRFWELDFRINDRGIKIDTVSARKLMAIAKIVVAKADARIAILTRGVVTACTQATAIAKWVNSRGIHCESIGKEEIDGIIEQAEWCGDDVVVEVLELRKEFAKASAAKIKAMFECVCDDGRIRNQYQFRGAAITGRTAGRLVQLQNFPRIDEDEELPRVRRVFEILEGCGSNVVVAAERIRAEVGEVLPLVSKCLRGLLIAAPGHKLVGGDLSNVEGRGAAWLCGAEKKLKFFREMDAGLAPDLYKLTYAKTFGVPVEAVTKEQRQVGKVEELACLAADTPVLTDAGIKRLVDVTLFDKLWDGKQWTNHNGVIEKGVRQTVNVDGIRLTADHGVLLKETWREAQELVSSESCLSRALATGLESLPSRESNPDLWADCEKYWSRVRAGDPRIESTSVVCGAYAAPGVAIARKKLAEARGKITQGTRTSSQMIRIGAGFSTESRLYSKKSAPCEPVYDILNVGPRNRFAVVSRSGILIVHNCGFQGSVGAVVKFANKKLMSKIVEIVREAVSQEVWDATWEKFKGRRDRAEVTQAQWTAIKIVVDGWRRANPEIVAGWYALEEAALNAVKNPGVPYPVFGGKIVYVSQKRFLWCRLPSSRTIAYFNPAVATTCDEMVVCEDGKTRNVDSVPPDEIERLAAAGVEPFESNVREIIEFEGYAQRAKGGGKVWVKRTPGRKGNLNLYGGRLLENCLSRDTEVLTSVGWKAIIDVTLSDLLWDGCAWVTHGGLISQGSQKTHRFGGVGMTPDHKVWTNEGWKLSKDAHISEAAAASPCDEFGRPCVRKVDRIELRGVGRTKESLERSVRMWCGENSSRNGAGTGKIEELRVSRARHRGGQFHTRNVSTPSLLGVEIHARQVQIAITSRLQELRRTWHICVRGVVHVRQFLGGHGAVVSGGPDDREGRQQQRLLESKLLLGDPGCTGAQPEIESGHKHPGGLDACVRGSGAIWDREDNLAIQSGSQLACRSYVPEAGRIEQVYDLVNAGPNHRFAVRAHGGGIPFLVSNCDQAMCADLLFEIMERTEKAGFDLVLQTHDEQGAEVPLDREDLSVELMRECMTAPVKWAPGFPLAAKCNEAVRYSDLH